MVHLKFESSLSILSIKYSERLAEAWIEPSVSSIADSYDKCARRDHQRPVQGGGHPSARPWRTFKAVEFSPLEWVDWFNNRHLLETIGNMQPTEAEQNFYKTPEQHDMAA